MWFQVDKKALRDWRITQMATEESMSFGDAFHLCCLVWCHLYERGGGVMPVTEVDAVAEYQGMARAMVSVGLADDTPEGVRVHGDERAARYASFRQLQSERGTRSAEARKGNGKDKDATMVQPRLNQAASIDLSDQESRSSSKKGSPESLDLARYLLQAIQTHTPGHKGSPERWSRDIDLALRIDGHSPDDLRSVVDYAHRSPDGSFWASNLLSGAKLRKHAARLLISLRKAPRSSVAGGNDGGRVMTAEELAEWAAEEMARERERGER